MGPRDYRRALLGRWPALVAGLLVGALVGLVVALLVPAKYTSNTAVYLSPPTATADAQQAYQADQLAQERALYYAPLVTQNRVTETVAQRADPTLTARDVAQMITVAPTPGTPLLFVTVTDTSPARAQALAAATGDAVVALVAQTEKPTTPVGAASVDATGTTPPPPPAQPQVVATVIQPATFSPARQSTSPVVQVALGALVGLLVGAAVAIVRQAADRSIGSAEDLRAGTRLPVLGELRRGTDGFDRDAVGMLRTSVDHLGPRGGSRVLVLGGPRGGEESARTVAALAPSIASTGRTVAVVDANLREPTAAGLLGAGDGAGLGDVLGGRATLAVALRRGVSTGVDVLPPGTAPDDPSALLGSERLAEVVQELGASHDTVLVDVPPILAVADGSLVAAVADRVVLVSALGRTSVDDLDEAVGVLAVVGATTLGAVLTSGGARRRRSTRMRRPALPARPDRPALEPGPPAAGDGLPEDDTVPAGDTGRSEVDATTTIVTSSVRPSPHPRDDDDDPDDADGSGGATDTGTAVDHADERPAVGSEPTVRIGPDDGRNGGGPRVV